MPHSDTFRPMNPQRPAPRPLDGESAVDRAYAHIGACGDASARTRATAVLILAIFDEFYGLLCEYPYRAMVAFECMDPHASIQISQERLALYSRYISGIDADLIAGALRVPGFSTPVRDLDANARAFCGYHLKVIRDRPTTSYKWGEYPGVAAVVDKYRLVHDINRAGSMLDNVMYYNLRLDRDMFDSALLEELCRESADSVQVDADGVFFRSLIVHEQARRRNR